MHVSPLNATKPPLRNAVKAKSIHLEEFDAVDNSDAKLSDTAKGKRRDWLTLMVRETLGPSALSRNVPENILDTYLFSERQTYHILTEDRSRV